jgi:hypothetical protein
MLIPIPAQASVTERLVATGRAKPARRDLLALGRPTGPASTALSSALRDVRDDRV